MGIDLFYGGQSNVINTTANKRLYFGDVYREPRRKRYFSKDKLNSEKDINKKSIHSYFSKDVTKRNISTYLHSNKYRNYNNNKEEDFQNKINSSISTISSNSSNDEEKKIIGSTNKENYLKMLSPKNNNNNFRKSYYQRLINKNIDNFNREILKTNTLFIFDWDDTLFFTTHINPLKNSSFFMNQKQKKD